jgi:TonB family protein
VQATGFASIRAVAPEVKITTTTVGAFESRPANDPRPGSDVSTGGVIASGFDKPSAQITGTPTPRVVSNAGFGSGAAISSASSRTDLVRTSGFAENRPTPAAHVAPRPAQAGTPVEVLYKPTPAYTDEARALKVEGEVVLEVEFGATGQVRVVRVVRGLGHGLDDMAVRAAEQIRFTPALSGGQPVDFRAMVQIIFRLT